MRAEDNSPAPFNWRRLPGGVLVTACMGGWARLSSEEFRLFAAGRLKKGPALARLRAAGLLRTRLDMESLSADWSDSNDYLRRGPGLHILVLTQRCNHRCVYCQAGEVTGRSMTAATARRAIDTAFSAPVDGLAIEFQGGEPLMNWPVLKSAVAYARAKARRTGKDLELSVVSNFSLMDAAKAAFLIENGVAVCTSLDGPAGLHDANRPYSGGSAHASAARWIEHFRRARGAEPPGGPSALLTVTRASLGRAREIVDEYARLGLPYVFPRPLSPMGLARRRWAEIGYSPSEFLAFYGEALRRVLELNLAGRRIKEKTAFLAVKKILGSQDNRYVDLRCPCGAGLGQLAYDWDGGVYTCDEGRMLARDGDLSFRLGSVGDGYAALIDAEPVKVCAVASSLDLQPSCARCAYRPYCGVCPAYNSSLQGGPWGNMAANGRCEIMKGTFDLLFGLLARKRWRAVFEDWLVSSQS